MVDGVSCDSPQILCHVEAGWVLRHELNPTSPLKRPGFAHAEPAVETCAGTHSDFGDQGLKYMHRALPSVCDQTGNTDRYSGATSRWAGSSLPCDHDLQG